jgi:hypothetical protein
MSKRRPITLPSLSILFGPDPQGPETKNGAAAEAGRREVFAMQAVAQPRSRTKELSFGIGEPNKVTDLSKVVAPDVQAKAEANVGYRFTMRVEMTPVQWAKVQDNPRQRDTLAHAKRAKHLRIYDPAHQFVSMAQLPDGTLYKLDGHTRSLLWSTGEVAGPKTLCVDVFTCDDVQAVQNLYSKIDSQSAVETGADKIAGAAKQHGLVFTSPLLRAGRYGTAVKRLYMLTAKDWTPWSDPRFIYDAVGFYVPELRRLDALTPQKSSFTVGVIMAALATFKRRGAEATKFWEAYAADQGVRNATTMDGVQALREAVVDVKLRAAGKGMDGGNAQQVALLGKGILAFEMYRSGRPYKAGKGGGVRNMDDPTLKEYLRRSVEG